MHALSKPTILHTSCKKGVDHVSISCLTLESDRSDVGDFLCVVCVTLVVVFALLAGLGKEK